MSTCPCCDERRELVVGVGEPPAWICVACFDDLMRTIGEALLHVVREKTS